MKFVAESGFEDYLINEHGDNFAQQAMASFVNVLKERIDLVKQKDQDIKEYGKIEKKKKRQVYVDSDLREYIDEEPFE